MKNKKIIIVLLYCSRFVFWQYRVLRLYESAIATTIDGKNNNKKQRRFALFFIYKFLSYFL